jgi:hypothetical protein
MATIIVLGQLAEAASLGRGGHTMWVMQVLHGLARLGQRVVFVEFVQRDPGVARGPMVSFFEETMAEGWRPDAAALLLEPTLESLAGLDRAAVAAAAREAAAVVTLAAHYRRLPYPLVDRVRPRVLFEQDPGFTHLWAAAGDPAKIYGEHDLYFTVGANVGTARCRLPTLGLAWRPLWNPVVLDWWSPRARITRDAFTTLADWRSHGFDYLEYEGRLLGPKADEFRKFLDLPVRTGEAFEMVTTIDPADPDRVELERAGWRLRPPRLTWSASQYHDFVQGSAAEFSVAKGAYVGTRSGWFSDRSACYLAAGRPVILQSTGFEDVLPTGRGLFAVTTLEEAIEAVRRIRADRAAHAAAARAIAAEHFDSDVGLGRLLAEVGVKRKPPWSAIARPAWAGGAAGPVRGTAAGAGG